jgi:hypothetical protein
MRARIEVDRRLSGTTDATIEEYITQARLLRQQYDVPTGYQQAPFFQSFVVVTVDPKGHAVTFRPWGIHGPLTWRQFDRSPGMMPVGASADQPVEWVIR